MSAITLETLQADFEAKRLAYAHESRALQQSSAIPLAAEPDMIYDLLVTMDADEWLEVFDPLTRPDVFAEWRAADLAAELYIIARDYGLNAAMVFKVTTGNIDPRKGGGA